MIGTPLDRREILDEYEWVSVDTDVEYMVIGTDLDALLSAAYCHEMYGWKVIGVYDLETIYYDPDHEDNLTDAVWIDLDVCDSRIKSIGHHILSFRPDDSLPGHENTLNPNLERGVFCEGYRFTRKCPLATIHFLLWLHEPDYYPGSPEDLETVSSREALLWLADSVWINGQEHQYRDNVETWSHSVMPLRFMIDSFGTIMEESFEEDMKNVIDGLTFDTGFSGVASQTSSYHSDYGGGQCTFDDPREAREDVETVLERIEDTMGWTVPDLPETYETATGDRTSRLSYEYDVCENYGGIDEWMADVDPFSFAVPYKHRINYTTDVGL